jgi:cell division transport system permease protein
MATSFDKFQKRRLLSSYFSVVLSIALVLFLLGILGVFLANSKRLVNEFKEKITMTVFLENNANDSITKAFGIKLKKEAFVKSINFVSKEQAAKEHSDIIGEDFMTFLGENPLQNSFDIQLKADFVDKKLAEKIEQSLRTETSVADVVYDKQLITLVNDNIKKISFWVLISTGVLTIIAVLLINSSLRLSIYANRFIIKTMQMVGATKSFIRKPFVIRSITLGLLGALLAIIGLIILLLYIDSRFSSLNILDDKLLIGVVFIGIIGIGAFITWISTHFATQRFLNLRTDDLY